MTLNEFKAWLEGYETSFTDEKPTAEQWAAVKAKLAEVAVVKDVQTHVVTMPGSQPFIELMGQPAGLWNPVTSICHEDQERVRVYPLEDAPARLT